MVYPNVAKVGGLQSQGAEGEAIVGYCDPSAIPPLAGQAQDRDLEPSGFPEGKKDGDKPNRSWNVPLGYSRNQVYS